jgi:regulatory protein
VAELTPDDIFKKARGYALRLFKFRPRSEAEFLAKLRDKGYAEDVRARLAAEFKRYEMLDDVAFAKAWMQGRLKKYGFSRVSRELLHKGIAKETIAELRAQLNPEADEEQVATEIAVRRSRQYRDLDPLKRRKRLMEYLARRGFGSEIIVKVVKSL